ncbi:MAG: hypothetical protein ACPG1C_12315 [Alphaproteobacteria bacterium]
MSWFSVAEAVFAEVEREERESGKKQPRTAAIAHAALILGKSESLISRYLTTYDVITRLMTDKTTDSLDILESIPFTVAEYIGRIARHDEDRAYGHVLAVLHGNAGVVEVRDDYLAMRAELKDGRSNIIERPEGQAPLERMTKAQFNDFVPDALTPLLSLPGEQILLPLEGLFPELDTSMIARLPGNKHVAITGYYQMPQKMSFPLAARFGRWAFSALHFHQYWIMVHPLSDPEPEVQQIREMADRYNIGSIGIAVSLAPYDYEVVRHPAPNYVPRPLP